MRKSMRVWVTRPEEDAAELAEALRAEGIEAPVEPLLRIVYVDGPPLDLAGTLAAAGFGYRREVLYEARTADRLSDELAANLGRGAVDAVLVFSPRTGATLMRLLQAAGLSTAARRVICFCLSHAVAAAVAPGAWREVVVAKQPTQAAMISAIAWARMRLPT